MSTPSIEDSFDFELHAEWKAELKAGKAPSGKGVRLSVKDQMWLAKRWLLWKFEPDDSKPDKPKKVPYYVGGGRRGKDIGLDTPEDIARLSHVWEANERQREFAAMSCCRFCGHEDKIVTKDLESGYDEAEVQPRVQDRGRQAGDGPWCGGGAGRP